jgi:hypothetical protein
MPKKSWKKVTIAEAKAHPLYGVKSWLIVFAVGVLLGGLRELGSLNIEAHKAGLTITQLLNIDHPAIHFAKISLWFNVGILVVIYWALLSKSPHFRLIASSLLLLSWPIGALIGLVSPFVGIGTALGMSLIPWMISCAVWVTYLNRSHRVRVTFEQLVWDFEPDKSARNELSNTLTGNRNLVENWSKAQIEQNKPINHSYSNVSPLDKSTNIFDSEDELWAMSLAEFDSPNRLSGLWAKCFSEALGNEEVAKAEYLLQRTMQLRHTQEVARNRRKQFEVAEHERKVFRATLTEKRAELLDCVEFARLNTTKTPIGTLKNIVRLLGGKLEWTSTGILSSGWQVKLNEDIQTFRDDSELSKWVLDTVLPMAETTFPLQAQATSLGCCPSCSATIPLYVVNCLGCKAVFGPGSVWKPEPLGGTQPHLSLSNLDKHQSLE